MGAAKSADRYFECGMRAFPLPIRILSDLVFGILYIFSKLLWRWRVENADELVSSDATGSVVICNHTSMAEVVVICAHVWRSGRRVRPLYKSEWDAVGIVRWLFSRVGGGIPIERGTADLKALRRAQRALARGEDVLIFPEGTRIRDEGRPVRIHGGFALLAQMAKAEIAPMAVCGFRDITPAGKHVPRPRKTWVRCGSRIDPAAAPANLRRRERLAWVEDESVSRMYAVRDELRREHPGRS
ncbi:1-acyl-sn-glycerol-3-phosphate acyltransferase [Coriobacterium glomerans PW2]|uniref:1-acyl-sn-glycerol-3-phosphate acyltransferase n=1 Tax=Coriobacterium glomerans (strain ATCC 49209 / DSM 20642 / JCM 10262 / PW2) TaxID=700015 RepID=F2N9I9_CORGP|nr:lysophospholipid acyltransferase family protein [Coriobacterium glomerans]AEB07018.1 1-acyl-sn-glycerol-3-phosphate acyltransferase [Coriobacterium glomerans PW2]